MIPTRENKHTKTACSAILVAILKIVAILIRGIGRSFQIISCTHNSHFRALNSLKLTN
jgi:hypothetical protein